MPDLLPDGIAHAFGTAAGELGHVGAAVLFLREIEAVHGGAGVAAFRDRLGRDFPVADAVAARWQGGWRPAAADPTPLLAPLRGIRRLAVVGLEAPQLDVLADVLPDVRIGLLTWSALPADWSRIIANAGGRVEAVDLDGILGWAGPDAAVLCFVYGDEPGTVYAPPGWLRLNGPDMRPQFRALVGWNVLPAPFTVYPRWFHAVPATDFTALVAA